jgi:CRISPR type IV-associated protein Csf3
MSFENLQITFFLDGTGLIIDKNEPIHLDALLAWSLIPKFVKLDNIGRSDKPFDCPLPLEKWNIKNQWGWKASALFPGDYQIETIQYWRKKFRQNRIEKMKGSVNTQQGIYREYNTPMCLLLTEKMIAYAVGEKSKIKKALKEIKHLGKKRAYGKGKVISVKVEEIEEDWSIVKDGKAMRWLPKKNGIRLVRCRPPYWNRIERINCCEVGEKYSNGKK